MSYDELSNYYRQFTEQNSAPLSTAANRVLQVIHKYYGLSDDTQLYRLAVGK